MRISYGRALFAVALVLLVVLSFRPVERAERWVDLALAPARALSEICRPLVWLSRHEASAAAERLRELFPAEYAARLALHADERRFAVPEDPELFQGRRFVHAHVVLRDAGNRDRIVIELEGADAAGIEPGMPVVSGEVYVGRVTSVDRALGRAAVDLVTGKSFFVGAGLWDPEGLEEPAAMVVGGLEIPPRGNREELALAIHNPSRSDTLRGVLRVDETLSLREPFQREARGFLLGSLIPIAEGRQGVAPALDYQDGLFQVAVVCPANVARPSTPAEQDVLSDGRWRKARALGVGDPAHQREGLKLAGGRWNGLARGAAVVCGARLIGRVQHAGVLTSDVALLGDLGFSVPALARLAGDPRPRVLGRLVSLGRDSRDGKLLFWWKPGTPLLAGGSAPSEIPAQLFTGAGELGVPRGLYIGDCLLPRDGGPHVLRVEQHADVKSLGELWVRELAGESEVLP